MVNRAKMFMIPENGKDFEVELVAFADGGPVNQIRTIHGSTCRVGVDIALLYSRNRLPVKDFPKPTRAHAPPNNSVVSQQQTNCTLFVYNSVPDMTKIWLMYPSTPRDALLRAVEQLYAELLSVAKGTTNWVRFDSEAILYQISTYYGASGAGVFDDYGKLMGINP